MEKLKIEEDNELIQTEMLMKSELSPLENKINEIKLKYIEEVSLITQKYKKEREKLVQKEKISKKRKTIPKTIKNQVWDTCIGAEIGIGKCYVCSKDIDSKIFECGHVVAVAKGGDTTIDNLKPICSTCNKSMGTMNLIEFKEQFFPQKNSQQKYKDSQITDKQSSLALSYNFPPPPSRDPFKIPVLKTSSSCPNNNLFCGIYANKCNLCK